MNHVLTVVGNPAAPDLAAEAAMRTLKALQARGARTDGIDWLAPGIAFDIPFDGIEAAAAEQAAAAVGLKADLLAQPVAARRKRLLLADMDSTMITIECIDELADFAGLKAEISAVTERAMRGELNFEEALRERVARLKGLDEDALQRCFDERLRFTPGARTLVRTMHGHGAYCALVSGGFTFFTSRVAAYLGFDEHRANLLAVGGGRLLGTVVPPVVGAPAKLAALRELSGAKGIAREETLAVGDGANDLPMIEAAGLGVAFRAKPKVAAAARARIDHGTLESLLYLQGYRPADFVP